MEYIQGPVCEGQDQVNDLTMHRSALIDKIFQGAETRCMNSKHYLDALFCTLVPKCHMILDKITGGKVSRDHITPRAHYQ
jgi:hypothetical protein